jgi:transposase
MKTPEPLDINEAQLEELSTRLDQGRLDPADVHLLKAALDTLLFLHRRMEEKDTAMQRVLRMIFGARTEKTRTVLKTKPAKKTGKGEAEKKRKGHGRRSAAEHRGAEKVAVDHEQLNPGGLCPDCAGESPGKLYDTKRPLQLLRFGAQPAITSAVFELQTLRCNRCGKTFSASAPSEAGHEKYAPEVAPMLALLRYGYGMPMNRLERMQEDFGVPLPAGTQWDLVQAYAGELQPVVDELRAQAALDGLFHNDDTGVKILSIEKEIEEARRAGQEPERTGMFSTGVITSNGERHIALFFSGRQHAGENLQDLLDQRPGGLSPPIQMCDGLDRNHPPNTKMKHANCTSHGRRGFVEVASSFPKECTYVLETVGFIYKNDRQTKGMTPEERLAYHQEHSAELMDEFKAWMDEKIKNKEVEPNSNLGKAINYMLKRWKAFTLFLRVPGVPLDNNICERALKMAIRHRNNSLFYKTENGARVGDLFMSLIHTCQLCSVNPFGYLTTLRRHAKQLAEAPANWMPWNYQATVSERLDR